MSTQNNAKSNTQTKELTAENMAGLMDELRQGQLEVLQKQENMARAVSDFDSRLGKLEGNVTKQAAQETLEAAVETAQVAKAGVLGKFKQSSTGKKVVIATVGTAVVAGTAYGAYKGYEMYQGRKAVQESNILGAEALGSAITPAKQDAIRQGLSLSK